MRVFVLTAVFKDETDMLHLEHECRKKRAKTSYQTFEVRDK
jgi:hypothetical protein